MNAFDILKETTDINHPRYLHLNGCYELAKELLEGLDISLPVKEKMLNTVLLHDIGYSSSVKVTGCHYVDGYNYLLDNHSDVCFEKVVCLHGDFVNITPIHHKDFVEGLYDSLSYLEFATLILVDYCDTHINGVGEEVTIEDRWNDLISRHNSNDERTMSDILNTKEYAYHTEKVINYILNILPKLA